MYEILTNAAVREADQRTIAAGVPGWELMERAGRAVAHQAAEHLPAGRRVVVVCGPGNNGGDGFVAARILAEEGYRVSLHLLGSRSALSGDAAWAAGTWSGEVSPLAAMDLAGAALVIDALFGTGLSRDLDGESAIAIRAINASKVRVVSADIPSGIDGDTGAVRGVAVMAHETVTFARRKPGHLLLPGRLHCGSVTVADIGISDGTIAALASPYAANAPGLWLPAYHRPEAAGHKYGRGHAIVVSGGIATTGAARLAARAALRVGAGLVTVASPPAALAVNAAHLTAIMVRPVEGPSGLETLLSDERLNALAIGPGAGVGEDTRGLVRVAAEAGRALVIDADGLTSFAVDGSAGLAALASLIHAKAKPTVLTPHDGEFSRLFKDVREISEAPSKLQRAVAAARHTGAVIVLKGADTVIASPDGRAVINDNGTPWLATAGTGDVLTGFITGLLAQGMPGREAAAAGVWLHGAAARAFGPGLIAEDLPEILPTVLKRLLDPSGRA
ncbi:MULTISPECIES: NAD(P)H-hydrate dehydratase [unclassified Chelatococcus]|uniref:NAD(P)H-hydrate dehydratase n=1 Tax=unclassified Chelatococcus TaxID=2638111 RepID=UPI001BCF8A26|nr:MULTISPECIES: NAD(P)H-hydrate dehydratase [unclassified Chelatococcus]CAH1672512.1 ADP-dependent (S)-NAD(P)H-hydrate dehydratase / NAD(P)H-hydrate epimerase [Hyphomicrobiales bacterium]MBS7738599.1 NAD(P)H-hydrate dehydratase [Chelatococcus sp. HY11]MBX3543003.1 NAD(P)H-hydrate dehydratase [Chelatococcus sp.]MCO5076871.1 NAD(P)H-hydrate dehydratase [Chelatococcus sp.]CAH1675244.1 ADP-dependent (S)-NAD(P)H-hydrate dehydratase / NAD(P)H-hydrate epimerase [Hyphomicrobiales bacterium]